MRNAGEAVGEVWLILFCRWSLLALQRVFYTSATAVKDVV